VLAGMAGRVLLTVVSLSGVVTCHA